jgi:hypothetical protein
MRRHLRLLLAAALILIQFACATVISGRNQKITIQSSPPGADVEVDQRAVGKTPIVMKVKRKQRHAIKVRKEGYLEESRMTNRAFNWWFTGNLLIGGLVGMATDFISGATYCVDPDSIHVKLIEAPMSPALPRSEGARP